MQAPADTYTDSLKADKEFVGKVFTDEHAGPTAPRVRQTVGTNRAEAQTGTRGQTRGEAQPKHSRTRWEHMRMQRNTSE